MAVGSARGCVLVRRVGLVLCLGVCLLGLEPGRAFVGELLAQSLGLGVRLLGGALCLLYLTASGFGSGAGLGRLGAEALRLLLRFVVCLLCLGVCLLGLEPGRAFVGELLAQSLGLGVCLLGGALCLLGELHGGVPAALGLLPCPLCLGVCLLGLEPGRAFVGELLAQSLGLGVRFPSGALCLLGELHGGVPAALGLLPCPLCLFGVTASGFGSGAGLGRLGAEALRLLLCLAGFAAGLVGVLLRGSRVLAGLFRLSAGLLGFAAGLGGLLLCLLDQGSGLQCPAHPSFGVGQALAELGGNDLRHTGCAGGLGFCAGLGR
ncbi:hypothetical protein [Streptomyces atacamensis]|uniref:hypothetical protein n=1 Tax=Streptomyces atacamensis TaxID=531966 RepID=UPI00399CE17C